MLPLNHTLGQIVQAERLRAIEARTASRLARADRHDQPGPTQLVSCSSTPATVPQRVAFRLGLVPASC